MAIDQGTETLDVTKSERTWRVEIFCESRADFWRQSDIDAANVAAT